MNNLSNERLLQRLQQFEAAGSDARAMEDSEFADECEDVASVIRELLALREAGKEPVGFATKRNGNMGSWLFTTKSMAENHNSTALDGKPALSEILPLYAAPQLPAVPDLSDAQVLEFLTVAFRHCRIVGDIELDDIRLGLKMAIAAAPKPEV